MRFRPRSARIRAAFFFHFAIVFLVSFASPSFAGERQETEDSGQQTSSQATDSETKIEKADPPPVTRIVMFNSGLSQIVHEGKLTGTRQIDMRFSEHDVDDVLKSLVFDDQDGGIVRSVEYNPAPDNQDVAASNLGPAMTLAQTLQKYRGESVVIKTTDAEIKGSILSVENRQTKDAFVETLTIVNEDGFGSIPLNDFQTINFENEKIRDEFQLAMAGLQKSRLANSKLITLTFEGEGEREVRYSYNVDSPIWRMTYRLDLKGKQSSLQGWAHIDNVTGVDWQDIQLDLRSGRPQSFHAELFAPVLAERMGVPLSIFDIPADKTLSTKNLRGGFGGSGSGGGSFGGGGFGGGGRPAGGNSSGGFDINSAIRAASTTGRSNKMVQFVLKDPVSIGAGRSAMIPVLTENVPVELFSMFTVNQETLENKQAAPPAANLVAQLQNRSATPLIPGPITLYQAGDFMGDSAMTRIEVDQPEELIYGKDLAVSLEVVRRKSQRKCDDVRVNEAGWVRISRTITDSNLYIFKNEDSIARKFLLKAPLTQKDVSPAPIRMQDKLGLYTIECPPKSSVNLEIIEKRVDVEQLAFRSLTETNLQSWKRDRATIAAEVTDRLERLFAARVKSDSISKERQKVSSRILTIEKEQTRITGLLKVLEADSPILNSYLDKLQETETDLAKAKEELKTITTQANAAREALDKLD